jgi:hypothetical protein
MEKRETPKANVIDRLRPKFNMEDQKDVEAWDLMCNIDKISVQALLEDTVIDMINELKQIEEQIMTFEKQRLSNLNNRVLRTQCRTIIEALRKDRDGLRQTLGSEAYKRMASELGRRTL